MSDAVIGLIGAVFGVVITELLRALYRRERYRDATFEKRLSTHQEAYFLNYELYEALNSNNIVEIRSKANSMKEWWKKNSLYLDNNSSKSMLSLFSSSIQYCLHPDRPQGLQPVWDILDKNLKDITQGIGAQHLPREDDIPPESNSPTAEPSSNFLRKILKAFKKYWSLIPFILVFIGTVAYLIYVSFIIPHSDSYTLATQWKYICYSLASTIALLAAFLATKNRHLIIVLIFAIELFLAGMIFELLDFRI